MIDCTLDSTTLVDIARGKVLPPPLSSRFSSAGLSHVVLGELLLGVLKSSNPEMEQQKTFRILRGLTVLHGDQKTATIYASVRCNLERRGAIIPHNDIWIAAASIQSDVPLITRDQHFRRVRELQLIEY
jgi:tRNA(fMet)-specific endonuclease VapC